MGINHGASYGFNNATVITESNCLLLTDQIWGTLNLTGGHSVATRGAGGVPGFLTSAFFSKMPKNAKEISRLGLNEVTEVLKTLVLDFLVFFK